MTNEELETYIREALRQLAYQATPVQPDDTSRLLAASQAQQITGRWKGYARHMIQKGTLLSVPEEQEQSVVLANETSAITAMRFTFESSGDDQFSGDGELDIDLSQLSIEFIKSVYVDIKGEVLRGRYVFEAQDIQDAGCQVQFTATLSEDGQELNGTYHAIGLLTNEAVTGVFYLKNVAELRKGYEVITVEPMRRIVDLIRGANDFILATHFTPDIPPEDYIAAMLERLREEVLITRYVAMLPDAPKEAYSWLNRFRYPDSKTLDHYKEYWYDGIPLSTDIMVIDDKVAVQCFVPYPDATTYSFAICYYDPQIARWFRESIDALKSKRKRGSSTALIREQEPKFYD